MAQQSSFYNTDGTTRTYPSSKHIASKQHVAIYFQSVTTSTWSVIEQTLYDLVNNSIVFTDAPDSALYSQIEIRVADTAAELTESPSDIATVAGAIADVTTVAGSITAVETVSSNIASIGTVSGAIANVNTVATNVANINTVATNIVSVNAVATNITDVVSVADTIVPNIAEILLADTNATTATTQAGIATTKAGEASISATNAQLSAWEAEAERLTADSYATEAEDVFVKVYTSDGDGTFTATNTTEYSALHWRNKAASLAVGQASNISVIPTGDIASTDVQSALAELDTEKISASNIHNATSKTAPVDADEFGFLDSVAGAWSLVKLTYAQLKAALFNSPAFTGTPSAPTAVVGTNTTQIATTAFVQGEGFSKIVKGTAVASTSGTYIDFTGIPSWAKRITVYLEGVSTSGTSQIMVQLGSSGLKTSGYLGTANGSFDTAPAGANHSSGFLFSKVTVATYLLNGVMTITNKSGNSWVETSTISSSTTPAIAIGSGSVPMSGSVDTVRVTMLNGTDTFDAGSINIMWEG